MLCVSVAKPNKLKEDDEPRYEELNMDEATKRKQRKASPAWLLI